MVDFFLLVAIEPIAQICLQLSGDLRRPMHPKKKLTNRRQGS